jgi:hypothetical protein
MKTWLAGVAVDGELMLVPFHAPSVQRAKEERAEAPSGSSRQRIPSAYRFTATYFVSRYSSIPSLPPSRPKPDCFTPPNGAAGLETMP